MSEFDPLAMEIILNTKTETGFLMPDDLIMSLLDRAEKDGVLSAIFYGSKDYTKIDFLLKAKSEKDVLFIVKYGDDIAGFGLLDEIRWHKAGFHFCIFSEYWGTSLAVEGSKEIYKRFLNAFSVLIGVVPVDNVFAIGFCRKIGLRQIGVIPKYFYNDTLEKHIDGVQFVAAREG